MKLATILATFLVAYWLVVEWSGRIMDCGTRLDRDAGPEPWFA